MPEDDRSQPTGLTSGPIGYPQHIESFETYFYLGESRTLKAASRLRFPQLVPDCPSNSPLYHSKFESFYKKFQRWAHAEDWDGWCIRKSYEERQQREKEARTRLMTVDTTLRTYQSLVQQSLLVWADKVKASLEMRKAIISGDQERQIELGSRERFEIRTPQEVKTFMELSLFLAEKLEQMPAIPPSEKDKLTEQEQERVDHLMEILRKRVVDTPYVAAVDESGGDGGGGEGGGETGSAV